MYTRLIRVISPSNPNQEWLNYLTVYYNDGNYYSGGLPGGNTQLVYDVVDKAFTWNEAFNQFELDSLFGSEGFVIDPDSNL